jgi:glycosyltransferase involved in cell wall biosynthesis
MRCPRLSELPPPPTGKCGWPWTEESIQLPQTMPDGSPWPKISIVTPSFNQDRFLEETIRSVLLQGYPDLDYIVIDGRSTDNSVEIIRKYDSWISYWKSEPDRGQSHAINKGFKRTSGEIIAWLNSDDTYLPNAFTKVVYSKWHNPPIHVIYGSAIFIDEDSHPVWEYIAKPLVNGPMRMKFWEGWYVPQPTVFFEKKLISAFGGLDETFQYALDYEWFIRLSKNVPFCRAPHLLATYRRHSQSKTADGQTTKPLFYHECYRANRKHAPLNSPMNWGLWLSWSIYVLKCRAYEFFLNKSNQLSTFYGRSKKSHPACR